MFRAIQNEMNSMQLPFKINAVDNDQGVPESLWKRISEI